MDEIRVTGDTIYFKGYAIAKLVERPLVPATVMGNFTDYIQNLTYADEDARVEQAGRDARGELRDKLKAELDEVNEDPMPIKRVLEVLDDIEV
jgi:hypothetical protein